MWLGCLCYWMSGADFKDSKEGKRETIFFPCLSLDLVFLSDVLPRSGVPYQNSRLHMLLQQATCRHRRSQSWSIWCYFLTKACLLRSAWSILSLWTWSRASMPGSLTTIASTTPTSFSRRSLQSSHRWRQASQTPSYQTLRLIPGRGRFNEENSGKRVQFSWNNPTDNT